MRLFRLHPFDILSWLMEEGEIRNKYIYSTEVLGVYPMRSDRLVGSRLKILNRANILVWA
jgi:hypothetical protein